jgi:predicted RNase H-like HicB family nuclease
MKLPFTVKVFMDNSSKDAPWVAYNPELDVASCGHNEKKARQNLKEALDIVLVGAKKDGSLEELLKNAGFTVKGSSIQPPKVIIENIPFPSI